MAKSKFMSKYISDEEIKHILYEQVNKLKKGLSDVSHSAALSFYSDYRPKYYTRTFSFKDVFQISGKFNKQDMSYTLEFMYTADRVNVNWDGDSQEAFYHDYILGYHGGPKKTKGGSWTFASTPRSEKSPWDIVYEYWQNL